MKKVTVKSKDIIHLYDLNDEDIIGIEFSNLVRAKLVKVKRSKYVTIRLCGNNSHDSLISKESIQSLIEHLKNIKNIYVFENSLELGEWLIEKL